jgi:hypothetical protein
MITANSFMKREFGKKLVEHYIVRWDVTHVIDTSRAHIPGHGTPTVIILGRHRAPVASTIRAVMGIRAEAEAPADPTQGRVWQAIINQVDYPASESDYVSVADTPRTSFYKHPWSIGGGGAAELHERLSGSAASSLAAASIGIASWPGIDKITVAAEAGARRLRWPTAYVRPFIAGDMIRDWAASTEELASCPYDNEGNLVPIGQFESWHRFLWSYRMPLLSRVLVSGETVAEAGVPWWAWVRWIAHRYKARFRIIFAFVATHNHFVLDRGGLVFNRHSPTIVLPEDAGEDEYLGLLGLLNSSIACFWAKQVAHNKGGGGIGGGLATEAWEQFYEFDGSKLKRFPIPAAKPLALGKVLDSIASELGKTFPAVLIRERTPTRGLLVEAKMRSTQLLQQMIARQEELDWQCYRLYGLVEDNVTLRNETPPPIRLGERAFEIVMARNMADGELETTWFLRHGSTPITELPAHWPADYRALVERRIAVIESDRNIALIEQPECKRRWNVEPWDEQESRALRAWLLRRLEEAQNWSHIELSTCARLADCLESDVEFRQVAELYRGRSDFDLTALIGELIEPESVPLLSTLRFSASGIRKRVTWERTWELQRREDSIDAEVRLLPRPHHQQCDARRLDVVPERVGAAVGGVRSLLADRRRRQRHRGDRRRPGAGHPRYRRRNPVPVSGVGQQPEAFPRLAYRGSKLLPGLLCVGVRQAEIGLPYQRERGGRLHRQQHPIPEPEADPDCGGLRAPDYFLRRRRVSVPDQHRRLRR